MFIFLDVHKIVSTIEGVEVPISTNIVGRDTGRGEVWGLRFGVGGNTNNSRKHGR